MDTDYLMRKLPLREHWKNSIKILRYVYEMDRCYFPGMGISLLLKAMVPYMELLLSAYILDGISAHTGLKEMLTVITALVAAIMLVQCIAGAIYNRMEVHREQMSYLYSCETQTKMLEMDFSRIDSPEVKALKDRIRKDNNWGAGVNSVFWNFNAILENVFHLIGAIVVGLPVAGYLIRSGTAVSWMILTILVIAQIITVHLRTHFRRQGDYWRYHEAKSVEEKEATYCFAWDFAGQESYNYKNGKDIRIYGGYDLMERWTMEVLRHKEFRGAMIKASWGDAGDQFFSAMAGAAMSGGAYLIMVAAALAGTITVGNVVRFAGCLSKFLEAATGIIQGVPDFALTARKQLSTLELIHLENEMYPGKLPVEKRSDGEYRIEFRNVSFKYPGTERYALKNLSLELTVGEKLAIVGMNGSGKTTMIKLLCRLYDPLEGEILLNGVDIRKFKQDEYSRLFSVVFQDFTLYPFPLAQNIAIARAIYKEAPFILLDEPTAALDPLAEYEIYSNFDKIAGTKTAVYISHRLSSCRFCEKIAVFHEGELVQLGNHEELVADRDGKYYELWSAQAQYYGED